MGCGCDGKGSEGVSILESIKEDLGAAEWEDAFDTTLIADINAVFMILSQIGVGPSPAFRITGPDETWDDFDIFGADIAAVQTYMATRVRMMFDKPSSSFALEADKEIANELEWRLNVAVDPDLI